MRPKTRRSPRVSHLEKFPDFMLIMMLVLLLPSLCLAADFFTDMNNHIGCFFDRPEDR